MTSWSDHENDRIVHITHLGREAPAVADLERRNHDLRLSVIRLEDALAEERREVARLRAVLAPRAQQPRLRDVVLAFLVTRLEAADKRMRRWGL